MVLDGKTGCIQGHDNTHIRPWYQGRRQGGSWRNLRPNWFRGKNPQHYAFSVLWKLQNAIVIRPKTRAKGLTAPPQNSTPLSAFDNLLFITKW